MVKNVVISKANYTPPKFLDVEIVERKGLGHPDTLIDGIMEHISRELCKTYIDEFGTILHHNVDKGQIVGGNVHVEYGGGKFIQPIFILLSGRATFEAEGHVFPVEEIALETTRKYLKKAVRHLNVDGDIEIMSKIRPGSKDLVDLFLRQKDNPLANDTSFGVGFAPMSELENIVLNVEKSLNSNEFKQSHPWIGEDIKVMGLRERDKFKITIAAAIISKYINSIDDYISALDEIKKKASEVVEKYTNKEYSIYINTSDDIERESIYLTLTGTSAEMGDDGSVGRGNRANGLITPFRLMTLEAAAGKNPVNHVGKIYSVLAFKIANEIADEVEADDISVSLLSQIGKPISDPKMAFVEIVGAKNYDDAMSKAKYIVEKNFENINELTIDIVNGKYSIYW